MPATPAEPRPCRGPRSVGSLPGPEEFDADAFTEGPRYERIDEELGHRLRGSREGNPRGASRDAARAGKAVATARARRRAGRVRVLGVAGTDYAAWPPGLAWPLNGLFALAVRGPAGVED